MAQPPKPNDLSTDIIEILKAQPAPSADLARKEETLFRATELFSEKISNQPQKIGLTARLFGIRGNKAPNQREGFMKKRHIMMASVATIAMLAVTLPIAEPIDNTFDTRQFGVQQNGMLMNTQRNEPQNSGASILGHLGNMISEAVDGSSPPEEVAQFYSMPTPSPQPTAPLITEIWRQTFIDNQPEIQADKFSNRPDQQMQDVASQPVSTFSADVDTASYTWVRKVLMAGAMPEPVAVRTEEFINYFDYNYPTPDNAEKLAFAATTSVLPNPWNKASKLIHIGIKGSEPAALANERAAANIVLLVDVSGSMGSPRKLPLAQKSFIMMLDKLQEDDTVSIVTYAGYSAVVLPPTPVTQKEIIRNAIISLSAGGGTAGAEGINTAYRLARESFKEGGINRIFLATDGDFNVGVSSPGELANLVSREKDNGIFLSVLGFGVYAYYDRMMQGLAQNGNGVASFIDDESEAKRVLVDNLAANLVTIAKDVKLQVEFDPSKVSSYRLLGYETRALKREDFDNDKVDAGDIGSGHEVTAIYEIVPKIDFSTLEANTPIAELRIRYKAPDAILSERIDHKITVNHAQLSDISEANTDARFAVAVAGFSRLLRGSDGMSNFGMQQVYDLAKSATGEDADNSRHEFLTLVKKAISLGLGREVVPMDQGGVAFPP